MVARMEIRDAELDPRFPDRITREAWARMGDAGELDDKRIELVRGRVVRVSPIKNPHIRVHTYLVRAFIEKLDATFDVQGQGALAANIDSEPQPDIMIVAADRPADDLPDAALLVVEISVSTLRYDRGTKLELYAESGIPEYWVIDVPKQLVYVHTQPDRSARRYLSVSTLRAGDVLRPTLLPAVAIPVADLPR